jgi:hypothetical protein
MRTPKRTPKQDVTLVKADVVQVPEAASPPGRRRFLRAGGVLVASGATGMTVRAVSAQSTAAGGNVPASPPAVPEWI